MTKTNTFSYGITHSPTMSNIGRRKSPATSTVYWKKSKVSNGVWFAIFNKSKNVFVSPSKSHMEKSIFWINLKQLFSLRKGNRRNVRWSEMKELKEIKTRKGFQELHNQTNLCIELTKKSSFVLWNQRLQILVNQT